MWNNGDNTKWEAVYMCVGGSHTVMVRHGPLYVKIADMPGALDVSPWGNNALNIPRFNVFLL